MTVQATPLFERETIYRIKGPTVYILSIIVHVVIIIVIPLLSSIFHSSKKFERPKTFQLVSSPLRPNPTRRIPVKEDAIRQRKPQEQRTEQPRQTPDSNTPKKQRDARKEQDAAKPIREDLDELSSILDEIPAPAQVSAVGTFKYHWYLNKIRDLVERNWKPTSENRTVKVVISFTINKNGSSSDPVISSSSGNSTLDNLALRAVKLAAPLFGKLPAGFEGDQLDLNLTLIPTRQ